MVNDGNIVCECLLIKESMITGILPIDCRLEIVNIIDYSKYKRLRLHVKTRKSSFMFYFSIIKSRRPAEIPEMQKLSDSFLRFSGLYSIILKRR